MSNVTGKIHSFQSLGTLDGPGIRFVVFMQGCNLRCSCCHNPDTWNMTEGTEYTPEEVLSKVVRFREYFGEEGGITVSGGEPLLQSGFVYELFRLCHKNGINTCLDTSGSLLNEKTELLLSETDRVLLDIKYQDDESYKKYVGCSIDAPLAFLDYLDKISMPVTIRQVIIPSINDNEDSILFLRKLKTDFNCIDKIELLPFRKICQVKYDDMGIDFPFKDICIPSKELMDKLNNLL